MGNSQTTKRQPGKGSFVRRLFGRKENTKTLGSPTPDMDHALDEAERYYYKPPPADGDTISIFGGEVIDLESVSLDEFGDDDDSISDLESHLGI